MQATQLDFIPGYDVSSLGLASQQQLIQAIHQLKPLSNIGGVIWGSSNNGTVWPSITNNERFMRYIWIDTYIQDKPVIKVYDNSNQDTYENWIIPRHTVTRIEAMTYLSEWTLPTVGPWNRTIAHDLGSIPTYVRLTLLCLTDDEPTGYVANDEVEFTSAYLVEGIAGYHIATVLPTANGISLAFYDASVARRVYHKTNGTAADLDNTKWKVKAYLTL
jgi:hypothetical protein